MTGSKPRAKARQRQRQQVAEAVDPLPPRYVLEEMAKRLGLTNGSLEVRIRNGFLQYATVTHVLSAEETEFPNRWTEKEKEAFWEDYTRTMREFNEMMGNKQTEQQLRSTLRTEDFSAAQLLEREPKPMREGHKPGTLNSDKR